MRVLHVITRFVRGGARNVVLEIIGRSMERGVQHAVACGMEDVQREEVESAVHRVGGRVFWIPPLIRRIQPERDLLAVRLLRGILQFYRPHIVHGHTYKTSVLASIMGRFCGIRGVVMTPHGHVFASGARIPGVPERGWKRGLLYVAARVASACAHRVTAISEPDLRDHIRMGLASEAKMELIPSGINMERFNGMSEHEGRAMREKFGTPGPIIGTMGRLTQEKGHEVLLEAFGFIQSRHPKALLVIGGEGTLDGKLRAKAQALGIASSVQFLGHIEDPAPFLSSLDVYVHPSHFEGLGLAVAEAMAAGRPVVATQVGGVTGLIQHGVTGFLVPPRDSRGLAEGVIQVLSEPALGQRLAQEGRARVQALFSADRMAAAYDSLYRRLAGDGNV